MSPQLLSTQELSAYLQIPVATIHAWRSRGKGGPPGIRIGRHVRYRMSDVEQWLQERAGQSK